MNVSIYSKLPLILAASTLGLAACLVQTQPQEPAYVTPPPPPPARITPAHPPARGAALRAVGPVNCRGTETIRLERVIIETRGPAVTARNRCTVEIIDSRIVSGEWAIRMNGETAVTLVRTQVEGAQGAAKLNDSAVLSARQTTFVGALERLGRSIYRDQGGNRWHPGARR